jgi:hypothetical protein
MTQHDIWKTSIKELAHHQVLLTGNGGPTEDPDLYEEIIMREIRLLKSFGLPDTQEFVRIITFEDIPNEATIMEKINALKNAATTYLLTDAKSELKTLQNAKALRLSPFNVLPAINIRTHIYTIFVYDKILLAGKDSIENVWVELKITRDPQVLEYTGKLGIKSYDFEKNIDFVKLLEHKGLKYLHQFINAQTALLSDENY